MMWLPRALGWENSSHFPFNWRS